MAFYKWKFDLFLNCSLFCSRLFFGIFFFIPSRSACVLKVFISMVYSNEILCSHRPMHSQKFVSLPSPPALSFLLDTKQKNVHRGKKKTFFFLFREQRACIAQAHKINIIYGPFYCRFLYPVCDVWFVMLCCIHPAISFVVLEININEFGKIYVIL